MKNYENQAQPLFRDNTARVQFYLCVLSSIALLAAWGCSLSWALEAGYRDGAKAGYDDGMDACWQELTPR